MIASERLHHKKAHSANINCATQTLAVTSELRGSNLRYKLVGFAPRAARDNIQ